MKLTLSAVALLSATLFLSSRTALARWALPEEADFSIEFDNADIAVASDGNYVDTEEIEIGIQNDQGKQSQAVQKIYYEPDFESLTVEGAKTINPLSDVLVAPRLIEDKAIASSPQGFNRIHQVMIAFPDVQIGSKIYFKYIRRSKRPIVPGFFSTEMLYGLGELEKAGTVTIKSDLPLYIKKTDPDDSLDVVFQKGIPSSMLKVTLKKPVFREVLEEPGGILDPGALTRIEIASSPSWFDFGYAMQKGFENVLEQPLPPALEKIYETAAKETSLSGQVNSVLSGLSSTLNYLGDWRTVQGKFSPRDLKTLMSDRQADCKDFATASAAIFRKLGLKAWVALVHRGEIPFLAKVPISLLRPNLPTTHEFDHAIVYLETQGKEYWIDPTNPASFGLGLRDDIADRDALILKPGEFGLTHIPATDPLTDVIEVDRELNISDGGQYDATGTIHLSGRAAVPFTGLRKKMSSQQLDSLIAKIIATDKVPSFYSVDPYDLSSNVVKDLVFKVKYSGVLSPSNDDGPSFYLPPEYSLIWAKLNTQSRETGLYIGVPQTIRKTFTLKGISLLHPNADKCWIVSPWIDASLDNKRIPGGVELKETFQIKKPMITKAELQSPDYQVAASDLESCFLGRNIRYRMGEPPKETPKIPQPSDTSLASRLLAYVPFHKMSSSSMGRAPASIDSDSASDSIEEARDLINNWNGNNQDLIEAKDIANQWVAHHPNDPDGYTQRARAEKDLGYLSGEKYSSENLQAALDDVNKAIALAPNSFFALYARFDIFNDMKRPTEARADLVRAIKNAPTDAWKFSALSTLAFHDRNYGEAIEDMNQAVENGSKKDLNYYYYMSNLDLCDKRTDLAEKTFKEGLSHYPNDAWLRIDYSGLLQKLGQYDQAITEAEAALKSKKFGMGYKILASDYLERGISRAKAKDDMNAIPDFKRAIEYDPSADAYYDLSLSYARIAKNTGDSEEFRLANEFVGRSLAMNPDLKKAKTLKNYLASHGPR